MACPNENCVPNCSCNNCCPPPTPPTPPTPPDCTGTSCTELYDGACVVYSGANISCFGITTNMTFNSIIQAIAQTLCDCAGSLPSCTNPLENFVNKVLQMYNSLESYNPGENDLQIIVETALSEGMVFKKCEYCCPDSFMYALAFTSDIYQNLIDVIKLIESVEPVTVPCLNCAQDFATCNTALLNLSGDPELVSETFEFGGFNGISGLCYLKDLLTGQTEDVVASFIKEIENNGLVVACDDAHGDIFIGSVGTYAQYAEAIIYYNK
jgi:hypothetical protein